MKRMFIAFFCALVLAAPVSAMSSPGPAEDVKAVEALLKGKTEAVLTVLQDPVLDVEAKKAKVMEIIQPIMDFPLMAKLTLGRDNWSRFSPDQQAQFVDLFVERLKRSYLDKTAFYNDEKILHQPGTAAGNKVHVPMTIVSGDKPIELLYKFYNAGGRGWMVYDLEINGVSLIKSYQAQFSEILKTETPDDLLAELRNRQAE